MPSPATTLLYGEGTPAVAFNLWEEPVAVGNRFWLADVLTKCVRLVPTTHGMLKEEVRVGEVQISIVFRLVVNALGVVVLEFIIKVSGLEVLAAVQGA